MKAWYSYYRCFSSLSSASYHYYYWMYWSWLLSAVYTSTNYRKRRVLWQEVTTMVDQGFPSIVGDFNYIDRIDEMRGGWPFMENIGSKKFDEFLHYNGQVDLDFICSRFTWCNNRSSVARVWERTDRIFVMASWIHHHPAHLVCHLSRIAFNYRSLLLTIDSTISYWIPFSIWKILAILPPLLRDCVEGVEASYERKF